MAAVIFEERMGGEGDREKMRYSATSVNGEQRANRRRDAEDEETKGELGEVSPAQWDSGRDLFVGERVDDKGKRGNAAVW
ncbi:hypothetical protein HAX54_048892 [Datura stramonium]|uniref:Uncharacterized protein n=1 Tax=Datura stramonium TaxID=4076 RepID=A0ABS8SU93_DATST|nr:hypothetical protein [Datura stramonium]